MDLNTQAIALRANDYKENDKLVALYTLQSGKITVHARGVRKNTAKLRFAVDQFCFGNYELAVNGDRYTLKNCQQLDSFYTLREDIVTYYAACCIAEMLLVGTEEGQSEPTLFVETLRALQALCEGVQPLTVVTRFALGFLQIEGNKLDFSRCAACGDKSKHLFVQFHRGVVCDNCRDVDAIPVGRSVSAACSLVDGMPYDKLKNISLTLDVQKDVLQLLNRYFGTLYYPVKSIGELVKLV